VPKWAKTIVAVLLLPFCIGAVRAFLRVLAQTGQADTIWVALAGGAACWLAVFFLLPKPIRLYVFGHELTHALSTVAFGGKVKKFKITPKGGHVVVTKNNFIIALAPYFLPLYVVLIVCSFVLGHLLWGWAPYMVWFHLLVGAAYSFHVTLTFHILQTRQTDITTQGYLFSAVIIFLGNIGVLLIGVPLLTDVPLLSALGWWMSESGAVFLRLRQWF
jgi:hypothetical protein